MRKKKWNVFLLTSALVLTLLGTRAAAAPKPVQQSQNEQAANKETASDSTIYRVSYRVNELENGKTINSRSYILMAETGKTATVRFGGQVPYMVGNESHQYHNVGMNIGCDISKHGESLDVHTKLDLSTFAGHGSGPLESYPVMVQFQLENSTAATLGKPTFVGSADDVNSNRRYVIEVTVTKAE